MLLQTFIQLSQIIDAWTGDQFANLRMALATKRAHVEVGSAGHIFEKALYAPTLRAKRFQPLLRPIAGRRSRPIEQLRLLARLDHFVH